MSCFKVAADDVIVSSNAPLRIKNASTEGLMSDADRSVAVVVIDRDMDRCNLMVKAFSVLGDVETFAWYIDGEGTWAPTAPVDVRPRLVICHYGGTEEEVLKAIKTIKASDAVFYSGGGGTEIPRKYAIWREITGQPRNVISGSEAEELLEFFSLSPANRDPEGTPGLLRPGYHYVLQSLTILCQAYLTLYKRLNDSDESARRYVTLMPDRVFCEAQLKRLESPEWWESIFGSPLPINSIKEKEWNTSRGNFERLNEFNRSLKKAEPLKREAVASLYAELAKQLRL